MEEEERDRERERVRRRREQMGEEERDRGRNEEEKREQLLYTSGRVLVYLGPMTRVCQHCQVLRFPSEPINYCHNDGKVYN